MSGAAVVVVLSVLVLAACGGDDGEPEADAGAESTTAPTGDRLVIRTRIVVADKEGAETIATGAVLERSTLGDSEFCVGGTIVDVHGSTDPGVALIARTIRCEDGRVELRLRPDVGEDQQGETQKGSWSLDRGTGAFEGLRGNGKMEVVYGPTEDSPVHETLTGAVTR
jgi:hypothetical protein